MTERVFDNIGIWWFRHVFVSMTVSHLAVRNVLQKMTMYIVFECMRVCVYQICIMTLRMLITFSVELSHSLRI